MEKDTKLTLQNYLEAAGESSQRTRFVIIIIAVASILTFAGLLNSLENTWMLQRVRAIANPDTSEKYILHKLPNLDPNDKESIKSARDKFYDAAVKSYVDNSYNIHVPFLGITFDVNDLGLIGGLGFIILLILFRLSLSRELDNLRLLFEQAKANKELRIFYNLLAMRQVLSVPHMESRDKEGGRGLAIVPKIISILPLIMLTVILGNDLRTYSAGDILSHWHTMVLYILGSALWTLVMILTISCIGVWLKIDATWNKYWGEVQSLKTLKLSSKFEQSHTSESD